MKGANNAERSRNLKEEGGGELVRKKEVGKE